MRKRTIMFIIVFMLALLAGCKSNNELSDFSKAFKNYDYTKTSGHRYSKTQRTDNIYIYEEVLDVKINKDEPLMAHKYYYQKKLSLFEVENQFEEQNYNEYYYKDSVGILDGEEIVWEKKEFSDFREIIKLPRFVFKKEYLDDINLTKLADYLLLKTNIKNEYTKDFFLVDIDIKDVYFEARIKDKALQEFKIIYTLDNSTVETTYRIYYDKHELDISYE